MERPEDVGEIGKCPWCGATGEGFADSPMPSDYCGHDPALTRPAGVPACPFIGSCEVSGEYFDRGGGGPFKCVHKPMQGLADWLRAVAETQAADAKQEACMLQWAREVDAACGVQGTSGGGNG